MTEQIVPESDLRLRRDGYFVLDLFGEAEISELRRIWHELSSARTPEWDPRGFFTSIQEPQWRADVERALRSFSDEVASRFRNHGVFISAFIVKRPRGDAITPHVDWSFVDERVRPTLNCWVATSELTVDTGSIGVLPGSHRSVNFARSVADPYLDWASATYEAQIEDTKPIALHPGQGLVYDNRLLHFSSPNHTDLERIVVSFGIAHHDDQDGALASLLEGLERAGAG